MSDGAFLWALQVLMLVFAPAGIGGAIFGAVAVPSAGRKMRLLGACAGWFTASVGAYIVAIVLVAGRRGTVTSDDQLGISLVLGVLLTVVAGAVFLARRRRPVSGRDGRSPRPQRHSDRR